MEERVLGSVRWLAAAVRSVRFSAPKVTRHPEDAAVGAWNAFVDIYKKRRRADWEFPFDSVGSFRESRDVQLDMPAIEGTRTARGETARRTLRVKATGTGKLTLVGESLVFRGSPEEAFDFLNEFYDIVAASQASGRSAS